MAPDSLLSGEGLWLLGRLQTAERLRAKAARNIHLTRGSKAFTPFLRSREERKDMWQIHAAELCGQGFYLFMRGRPQGSNNPDEEIQLPFV